MTEAIGKGLLVRSLDEVPEPYRIPLPVAQTEYLIDGEIRQWSGSVRTVLSPIWHETVEGPKPVVLGSYPLLTPEVSLQALAAARKAYDNGRGHWPNLPVQARIEHLKRFVTGMRSTRTEVVNLLMWEIGKTLKDAQKEFDRTVDYTVATLSALKQLHRDGSKFISEEGIVAQIRRSPLGVALCMGPYNYPLNETFCTLIPAVVMGNTVVFKPARHGVLLIRPLLKVFQETLPPGVVNVIYGDGRSTAGAVMATGDIDVFAFIGTHRGSNEIKRLHPKPNRLRSVLGLDAKNPAIVLADADLKLTVGEIVTGALSYNGQRCTALKLILVQRPIVEAFLEQLVAAVAALRLGLPWAESTHITPLPEPDKTAYLLGLVEDARAKGARVLNPGGGRVVHGYFTPTVLYPVTPDMRIYTEEQFGPILPIVAFDDLEEAIDVVVESNFGQQASIFGTDPAEMGKLIDPLMNQVGRLNLNSQCQRGPDTFPFNGRKDSAEGTLSVVDALRVFSLRTLVATKETPANQQLLGGIVRDHASNYLTTDYIF